MSTVTPHQIQIFKSVFKGREDVFAVRWEKGKKSGYMPAYFFDVYRYKAHKMKGGTFKNFSEKSFHYRSPSTIPVAAKSFRYARLSVLSQNN